MASSVGPFIVATDDGTMFHCSLIPVGSDQRLFWIFRDARGLEYLGPPARDERSREAVRALVAEWWANRDVRPIRPTD